MDAKRSRAGSGCAKIRSITEPDPPVCNMGSFQPVMGPTGTALPGDARRPGPTAQPSCAARPVRAPQDYPAGLRTVTAVSGRDLP